MWNPTHVEITVSRARNLKAKGKLGTNDAYVTIKLGKEKFQTTLRERTKEPEWHEQCQFPLSGENSIVRLKVFHRNLIGKDDFLGYAEIQLDSSLVYERPRSRWYNLGNKPGDKGPDKYRGEIEVFVTYVVESITGSHMNLNMTDKGKKRPSLKGLAHQFDKLNLKGSLKRNVGQTSGSISNLSNIEQASKTLPTSYRKTSLATTIIGSVEEENASEIDHQMLKDEPLPVMKSSGFKLPFRGAKNKRLQKMSLLSQSTIALPSMKSTGSEFGQMQESIGTPSESSSGFGSRTVSVSESQSSGAESNAQIKDSDDTLVTSHSTLASAEIEQGSSHDIPTQIIDQPDDGKSKTKYVGEQELTSATQGPLCVDAASTVEDVGTGTREAKEPLSKTKENLVPLTEILDVKESSGNELLSGGLSPEMPVLVSVKDHQESMPPEENFFSGEETTTALTSFDLFTASPELDFSNLQTESLGLQSQPTDMKPLSSEIQPVVVLAEPSAIKSEPTSKSERDDLFSGSLNADSKSTTLGPNSVDSNSNFYDSKLEALTQAPESTPRAVVSKHDSEVFPLESVRSNSESTSAKNESVDGRKESSVDQRLDSIKDACSGMNLALATEINREETDQFTVKSKPPVKDGEGSIDSSEINISPREQASVEEAETSAPSGPTLLLPEETLRQFCRHTRDDLIKLVLDQQKLLREKDAHIHDLENYIDNLLVKVIDFQPKILSANEMQSGATKSVPSSSSSSIRPGEASLPSLSSGTLPPNQKTTTGYAAYSKATKAASGSTHVTVVTSPRELGRKKLGFLKPLKSKK